MDDWSEDQLGDYLSFRNGKTSPERSENASFPVFGSNGLIGKSNEANARKDTIIIGRVGTYCGSLHFSKNRCWVTDNAIICSAPTKEARFWFYALSSLDLNNYRAGSGQPLLNQTILKEIRFLVPPMEERERIGGLLATLDDKIELNRQTNETLEALARALFKDWFVDFGPTRTKAEGGAPYLAPELWALFPDALDDEDKPVGWSFDRLGSHVKATKGLSYKGKGLVDQGEGLPLHNLNSVLEGGGYKHDGLKYYSEDYKERHVLKAGDLIVTNTEQGFDHLLIGYAAKIPAWTGAEGLYSHHLFKVTLRDKTPITPNWFYFALNSSWIGDAVRRYSNGTTVNMLPNDAFMHPRVLIPSPRIVRTFDNYVASMLEQQEQLFEESQTLAQTRDLLLPKLMSGEIRLRDAEREVEAVL
jgi:type I restriction enzyme S subunit